MNPIVLISPQVDQWIDFTGAMTRDSGMRVIKFHQGAEALTQVKKLRPSCVVVDAGLSDMSAVELVRRLMAIDATINVAVASNQAEEAFHEETEGLGIVMHLPARPGPEDAVCLMDRLKRLNG